MAMYVPGIRVFPLQVLDATKLFNLADTSSFLFPGISAFRQQAIIEPAAGLEDGFHSSLLGLGWIHPISIDSVHLHSLLCCNVALDGFLRDTAHAGGRVAPGPK
jgi:hypothetical protein